MSAVGYAPVAVPGELLPVVDTNAVMLVDLVMTIEAVDATDPLNLSRTAGFHLALNSDDIDGDGLTDSQETALGTNPSLADTDLDGLDDSSELNRDGNPLAYLVGVDTDPNNADTDGDGVPDGIDPDPLVSNSSAPYDGDLAPLGAPDGVVNAADVLIAQRITLGLITPTQLQLDHGDVYPVGTPDGVINISDLLLIQKMVLP